MFKKFHNNVHPLIVLSTYALLGLATLVLVPLAFILPAQAQSDAECAAHGGKVETVLVDHAFQFGPRQVNYTDECVGATK